MGTEKRQRKKEGRQARLEAERAAAQAAQRRRRLITAVVVSLGVFGILVLLAGRAGDDGGTTTEAGDTTEDTAGDDTGDDGATTTTVDPADKPEVEIPEGDPPTELVIEDLEVGEGPAAQAGDQVEVHYVGVFFDDGEEFDASWNRGSSFPFELGAGDVIQGWDQGVEGMQVGGRRAGIPPNSTLVFVVDLIGIG
jgi:peptidylprolyl isomerase